MYCYIVIFQVFIIAQGTRDKGAENLCAVSSNLTTKKDR